MIKLPEKKYEPKHSDELRAYAIGWNLTIEDAEYLCSKYVDRCAKERLLIIKEYASTKEEASFKGQYDCIVEIERLNAEEKEVKDLYDMFNGSLNMLNNLTIRRSLYRISSWREIIEQLMHQEEMQQEKLKKVSKI